MMATSTYLIVTGDSDNLSTCWGNTEGWAHETNGGAECSGDEPLMETQPETPAALPSSFVRATRVALGRRNAAARRELENLLERERLHAALAEIWEHAGDA